MKYSEMEKLIIVTKNPINKDNINYEFAAFDEDGKFVEAFKNKVEACDGVLKYNSPYSSPRVIADYIVEYTKKDKKYDTYFSHFGRKVSDL